MEQRLRITILKDAFQKWLVRVVLFKTGLYVKFNSIKSIHFSGLFLGEAPILVNRKLFVYVFFYFPKYKTDKKAAMSILKESSNTYSLSQILISEFYIMGINKNGISQLTWDSELGFFHMFCWVYNLEVSVKFSSSL